MTSKSEIPKMKKLLLVFLVLLQAMDRSAIDIDAGTGDFIQWLLLLVLIFLDLEPLAVPPVRVINASISQLYDNQVHFI